MNSPQLSSAQIEQIKSFTKKRYVRYEDVRFEIVDHLASDIEVQLSENPELQFDQALKISYKQFPTRGFAKFVQEKEIALSKYWKKKSP